MPRQAKVGLIAALAATLSACGPSPEGEDAGARALHEPATTLQCPTDLAESGDVDWPTDAQAAADDPVEVVGLWLQDALTERDTLAVLEQGGRPGATDTVAVVRDEATIGLVHLSPASDGGLLVSGYDVCAVGLDLP